MFRSIESVNFVFGNNASRAAEEGDWKECAKEITTGGGELVVFPSKDFNDPVQLLGRYDGWDGFITISNEDLIKLMKEKIRIS